MASSPLVDSAPFDFHGKRVLIFIVAYNAARTIEEVLNRIPSSLHSSAVEVLIIDDSSADDTFVEGLRFQHQRPPFQITVLRTPENQGYGGNQKLGYRYAIDHGFDIVALLHGDGQYAPEKLPESACSAGSGRSRCRLRFAHDRQESRANGRDAVLQMDRQPDPDHFPKLDAAERICRSFTPAIACMPPTRSRNCRSNAIAEPSTSTPRSSFSWC